MRYEKPYMELIEICVNVITGSGGLNDNITNPDDDGIDLRFV